MKIAFVITILGFLAFDAARGETNVPADAYVQVKDGHFSVGGKRLKLWGSQSSPLGDTTAAIDREVGHYRKLGFNLYRSISVSSEVPMDYVRGDGSRMDLQDYTFAAIAKSGGYNWVDVMNNLRINASDVDVIDDPLVSRDDWLAAMEGKALPPACAQLVWDQRTQAVYLNHIDKVMNHVNPYNGLRYADDPSIALIELVNEQWWTPQMLAGGELATLSPAIVKSLLIQWNQWLARRYGDDDGLRQAWGELLPTESLADSTVFLQPLRGRAAMPEMAAVQGIKIDMSKYQQLDSASNPARASDVVQFLMDLHVGFKTKAMERVRSHGKPGQGAAVVPILFDTGASYSPQSAYEHTFGSAFAFATYPSMIDTDRSKPAFPWYMPLSEPPTMGDWMTQNKIENVPGVIYETMTFQPGKYRADYPLRIASFAAIADLDVVDWHFYAEYAYGDKATPLRMPTENHYWEAVVFGGDEVMMASMKLAATIFLHGDLTPPAEPTILVVGKDVLFNPDASRWEPLRDRLAPTAMQFGMRLRFDPNEPKSHFIGPNKSSYDSICRPTPEITYRWKQGLLVIESPRVRVIAGFVPESFTFDGGEKLQDITLNVPEGTPYVEKNQRYVCFALCSQDDKPLAQSADVVAMAVSTSWNTGFRIDLDKYDAELKATSHGPLSAAKSINPGTMPVLVTRVGWTLNAPWLKGMTAERHDFSLETYRTDHLDGPSLHTKADEPLFFVNLKRN
jgi:hypothetical protein